ncbi:MAG TPA: thiamine phosphate synthase [Candidatus Acidoferrales bacterium]|nr:thiamine phosphate synthase [Candidatus Acidoferrales bacterium]
MCCLRSKLFAGLPLLRPAAHKPIVCYVTDRKSLTDAGIQADSTARILQGVQVALAADVDWVQIREKDLPASKLLELARRIAQFTTAQFAVSGHPVRILINDRLDVALAAGAHGVHLGRESAPVREVLQWCRAGNAPDNFVIGVSCHSLEEVREAEDAHADYVFFGPVFDTPFKRPFGKPQSVEKLGEVCRAVSIPVIAIGGVNQENAAACIRAGAAGVAAIRIFQEAINAETLRERVESIHNLSTEEK